METELRAFLQSKVVWGFGWALLHSTWQIAVVGAVAAVAMLALHVSSASTRYAVAYIALLSVPLGFGLTLWRVTVGDSPSGPLLWLNLLSPLGRFAPWLTLPWLLGFALASARLGGGWLRIAALGSARRQESVWQARVNAVAGRMGVRQVVRLIETAEASVPGVIGWLSPVMLFPVSALTGLDSRHVELIIAHELAHVRRHDYVMNLVQTAVETLFFFHPVMWWLSGRVRAEREHACDDLVVSRLGNRYEYALALTEMEQLRIQAPVVPVLAATGGHLLSRIRRLMAPERPLSGSVSLAGLVIPLFMFALVVARSAAVAAAPAIQGGVASVGSVWFGVLVGMVLGMRHALEPDHLVAISTMVTEERGAFRGARLGMSWGLGHTLTLVMAGTILALVRVSMPQRVADGFEMTVAIMLIGLGVRALKAAWRLGSSGPETIHAHGLLVHRHAGSADHLHFGSWVVSRRPLMVGMVHGLAGSGALAALVMASLPSISSQVAYIVLFGLGSTVGMAALSGCVGVPLSTLSRRPATLAWISGAAGILSVLAGVIWGGPVVWRWL